MHSSSSVMVYESATEEVNPSLRFRLCAKCKDSEVLNLYLGVDGNT